ncbi:phage integrase N-terminal domain-containing protein [Microbulbifer sp. ZKSA006]|uniref:phage integrase N-terminal domain-containing protein n=1 Tax=Microbulbifer sp. ZKSA006 TaxID=3243390 RepID=UPI004039AEA3
MRDLNYQLKNLCDHNKDGSQTTKADRHKKLQMMADHLFELGFRRMNANSLKPKHVDALVARYLSEGLNEGTIKNRLAALRWWAEKVGKPNVVAKDNAYYGIESRVFVTNESKARDLDRELLNKITSDHVRMSLELQKAFGLRREESIKFIPEYADQGNHIRLKATWCKGGRARTIPIRNESQREVLDRARSLAGLGSLIPSHLMYVDQMRIYESETNKVGLHKMHGLRHRYAQERYYELTGWQAPACGGPTRDELSEEKRLDDRVARLAITQELGHGREQVTAVYLGR